MTRDFSATFGPLHPIIPAENPACRMYSYDRPAYMLWNAIANQMAQNGWSDEEIYAWMRSRNPRYALDSLLGDLLIDVGRMHANSCSKVKT